MKITDMVSAKGTRYTIFVDGEYWYILDAEIISANHLQPGVEVTAELLAQLKEQAERRKARERALYLLSYRDHSRGELIEKLCRSVSAEIAEETADKMESFGYLNDENYAQKLAKELLKQKKYGDYRARFEMKKRHLSEDLIEWALSLEQQDFDSRQAIREIIERKYLRYLGDPKGVQKVMNALVRMGHHYSDIRGVIQELRETYDFDDEETIE